MRMRVSLIAAIAMLFLLVSGLQAQKSGDPNGHVQWVANALKEIESIKVGMRRKDLLKTFTTEGGFSTPLSRQYVYRSCRYIKVKVEFQPLQAGGKESPEDKIIRISKPYLENAIID